MPMRVNLARAMRSCVSHETLAGRLWPGINLRKEWKRYSRRAARRSVRAGTREHTKVGVDRLSDELVREARKNTQTLARLWLVARDALETSPLEFFARSKKGAYGFAVAAETTGILLEVLAATTVVRAGWRWWSAAPFDWIALSREVALSPGYLLLLTVMVVGAARVIGYRLRDLEVEQ